MMHLPGGIYTMKEQIWTVHRRGGISGAINTDYNDHVLDLLESFPNFKMCVKQNFKTYKAEMVADIYFVFGIAASSDTVIIRIARQSVVTKAYCKRKKASSQ